VQVDPIKPKLKLPVTRRFKPKCDGHLSNFAFNFNLRRHVKDSGFDRFAGIEGLRGCCVAKSVVAGTSQP